MELNLLASRLVSLELHPLPFFFFFLMKLFSNIYLRKYFPGFFRIINKHHYSFILFFPLTVSLLSFNTVQKFPTNESSDFVY